MVTVRLNICQRLQASRGFTLIELMVAMAVLAFGILGFLFLQARALHGRLYARELYRAQSVCYQQLDTLMEVDFDSPLLADGDHPTATEDTMDGTNDDGVLTISRQNFNYKVSWTVTDDVPAAGFKHIAVTTAWSILEKNPSSSSRQTKTITIDTVRRNEQ
jgi:prepilin-type N-terminal cleavage/methylation domain-containing protein